MRSSSNETMDRKSHLVVLEKGLGAPEITLDCYNGHIALIEIINLRRIISGQANGFVGEFRRNIYQMMEEVTLAWDVDQPIVLKTGWVGANLLLVGFERELSARIVESYIKSLTRGFSSLRSVIFADTEANTNHEVYLTNIKSVIAMVTRPKIMTYRSLASILINDIQAKKTANRLNYSGDNQHQGSALWETKSPQTIANPSSAAEQPELAHQESTRRFLRKAFRDCRVALKATPITNLVTNSWDSLSISAYGLSMMLDRTDLTPEMLRDAAGALGMRWELDTALVNQALNDMSVTIGQTQEQSDFKVNIPISLETIASWSRYRADIKDVLKQYDSRLIEKLRLIIEDTDNTLVSFENTDLGRVNNWLKDAASEHGIECFARWDNLEILEAAYQPLAVSGIKLDCDSGQITSAKNAETVIKSRNHYSKALMILLGRGFSEEEKQLAGGWGAEFAEENNCAPENDREFKEALSDLLQRKRSEESEDKAVVDARRRFRPTNTD